MPPDIRVLLCDDHAVIREGLKGVLDAVDGIDVVATARDGGEAVDLAIRLSPDVILMDIAMPEVNGVTATRRIVSAAPAARVVVLTAFADEATVLDAIDAGATGYLLKDADSLEVARAIRTAARGDAPLDTRAARIVLRRSVPDGSSDGMTVREREVLSLLASGHSPAQIGRTLDISVHTVRRHLANVSAKLGVKGMNALTRYAIRHGLDRTGS